MIHSIHCQLLWTHTATHPRQNKKRIQPLLSERLNTFYL